MATKFSALPAVTTVLATDEYPVARAGVSNKITGANLKAGIGAWVSYTPTVTGFSPTPGALGRYIVLGKMVTVVWSISGTSNATTFTASLPFAAASHTGSDPDFYAEVKGRDNTVHLTAPSLVEILTAATVATIYKDGAFAAWTASGTKAIVGQFAYEIP